MKTVLLNFLSGILIAGSLFGQDSLIYQSIFTTGISAEYGLGSYSVRDEYISKEKYQGTLPYLKVNWARSHNNYVYQLYLEYRSSSKIKNYNVAADIYQFSLNQAFLYSLPKMSLFTRGVFIFLGPATELYFYYNDQNIAVSGFDYAQSFASLFSLGLNSEFIYPLEYGFQVEGFLKLSVLSLGFRMVDSEEDEESPVKLLTLLSGTNASFGLGVRYYLIDNLSMKLSYRLHVTRISSWDPLISASDNLIVTLTYGF